ncbi:cytochrome c oxidase assembly protein [Metabacillus indicus]|uniref:Membrane protein n=1 Tax=Metabacillus indicus TaxID=246786 RepID=A0A084H191_METID|nr:cytochrome c oxidase assembly protein [Metabacillus indicus]KEZ53353.1 membrane protein [Metabacillus indicus]
MHHAHHTLSAGIQYIMAATFVLAAVLYAAAVIYSNRMYRKWPVYRTAFWLAGNLCAAAAVFGPLAEKAHGHFVFHMAGHLLLGMLAPLLMVLASPVKLLLRTLDTGRARRVTGILKSRAFYILAHPVPAAVLNVGGLWLLYTTNLYDMMHQSTFWHAAVHFHVFIAGYLFTASLLYIDPVFHRVSYLHRSAVLLGALAAHGILSKYLYARPPEGVPLNQAELGSMLMYYGGDVIDALIIVILCFKWYRSEKPGFDSRSVNSY